VLSDMFTTPPPAPALNNHSTSFPAYSLFRIHDLLCPMWEIFPIWYCILSGICDAVFTTRRVRCGKYFPYR
jgi:hypothetical protein